MCTGRTANCHRGNSGGMIAHNSLSSGLNPNCAIVIPYDTIPVMGAQQSSPSAGSPALVIQTDDTQGNSLPPSDISGRGAYRVTVSKPQADMSTDDLIEQAFQRGKQEAIESVQLSLEAVAAQVYDNVNKQLLELQEQHAHQATEMVSLMFSKSIQIYLICHC